MINQKNSPYKKIVFFFLIISFVKFASAQITKENFLIGGNRFFTSTTTDVNSDVGYTSAPKFTQLDLNPNIGYFFFNKVAAGLKMEYVRSTTDMSNINYTAKTISNKYGIGPFVRYYFLPTESKINILVEGDYYYERSTDKSKITDYF